MLNINNKIKKFVKTNFKLNKHFILNPKKSRINSNVLMY